MDIDHNLHKAIRAAEVLKEHLLEIADGDTEVIRDTLEGETQLHEIIAQAAAQNLLDAAMVNGISGVMEDLRSRKMRIEKRIEMRRAALLAAMQTAELTSLETPSGTLTRKAVPPAALILDETEIPSDFWKTQSPVLDKKAVLAALKTGTPVPGAMLSNGSETLQVRV